MRAGRTPTNAPSPSTPSLPIGSEPVALRRELRALLGEQSGASSEEIAHRLAQRQWRHWRVELAPRGVQLAAFRALVGSYRREVWLWALGDRSWEQMMEGLRGRCLRRFGGAACSKWM